MNKVYVIRCQDYSQVDERLADLLEMIGGMEQFVSAGERGVVLKPNLLRPAEPEKAITTHPTVVAAVGKMAKAAGAVAVIAESSGGAPYQERVLRELYQATGMDRAAEEAGIELNLDDRFEAVSFPNGHLIKRFDVISAVKEADGVINLCKFKTHTYMGMTVRICLPQAHHHGCSDRHGRGWTQQRPPPAGGLAAGCGQSAGAGRGG